MTLNTLLPIHNDTLPPIHKRWPDRFGMRLALYRKAREGSFFKVETDLTDEECAALVNLVAKVLERGNVEERELLTSRG